MAANRWATACTVAAALAIMVHEAEAQSFAPPEPKLLTPPSRRSPAPAAAAPIMEPAAVKPSLLAPSSSATPPASAAITAPRDLTPAFTADNRSGLKITKGAGVLPNDHGQVWREYDISPYTSRIKEGDRPQQAVIDWIVRDTGTEVWFGEPLGILSASGSTLRVYHTPEMQQRVREIVERLVATGAESHVLNVKLATVGSPNWRARAVSLLKPVDVKSPGVEAWLLSRENAAVLYEQLKPRGDFREHSGPQTQVQNRQSQTLARTQPRTYSRGVQVKGEFPFYDLIPGRIDEGYSLTISPLMMLDGKSVEAAIECQIDQVEKLVPVAIDVPIGKQSQRVQIQVPQVASWRLSERFRWPADQVLLLSCGVVANPAPNSAGPLALLNPLGAAGSRADALLLIEHRGAAAVESGTTANGTPVSSIAPAVFSPEPAAKPAVAPASAVSPFRRY
jgi:hypothetical protein